ncbi:MAG: hypothetical protein F7C81_00280 [Desulfurococcales archaeon]|nr:hypothetical protein [Desulfurococcales archaeon]
MATKRITIEVEVPEGVSEEDVLNFIGRRAGKLRILASLIRVKAREELTEEEIKLLKEIKRSVAKRAEERV